MRFYSAQGHPYSNDDGEPPIQLTPTGEVVWGVLILLVIVGVIIANRRRK